MPLTLEEKTHLCVEAADERKAKDIVVLNVYPHSSVADRFLICSGTSDRQVKAIANAIEEQLTQNGEKPLAIEGYQTAAWVLIDCADLIVHIFDEETRQFYDLERLWGHTEHLEVAGITPSAPRQPISEPLPVEEG